MSYDPAGPGGSSGPFSEPEQTPPDLSSEQPTESWTRPLYDRAERPPTPAAQESAAPGTGFGGVEASPAPYDVPASLELDYTEADMGLSPRAYDSAIAYERIERRRRGARGRKVARELVETVILALLIFFAVRAVVQNFRVEGASMEPSMHNDQYLLVNKAIYYRLDMGRLHDVLPFLPGSDDGERHLFRAPNRGDVVVFRFPLDPDRDFIKRVIGVPGDTVEIRDEKVYINGVALTENYVLATPNYTYGPRVVPAGMYFVLGDNRRNSFDSHAWGSSCSPQQQCEFVPEENIIGQAWITYWPFDQLGLINNKDIKIQAP